jgi:hypothetical protein
MHLQVDRRCVIEIYGYASPLLNWPRIDSHNLPTYKELKSGSNGAADTCRALFDAGLTLHWSCIPQHIEEFSCLQVV